MFAAWDWCSESWIPLLVPKPGPTARPPLALPWDKPWLPKSLRVFGKQGNLLPRDGWSHTVAALPLPCPSSNCDVCLGYCCSSSFLAAPKSLHLRSPASSSSLVFLKCSFGCVGSWLWCGILTVSWETFCRSADSQVVVCGLGSCGTWA